MPFCDDVSLLRLYAVTVTESATTLRLMDIEILKNEELVLEHASVHTTCIAVQIKVQHTVHGVKIQRGIVQDSSLRGRRIRHALREPVAL